MLSMQRPSWPALCLRWVTGCPVAACPTPTAACTTGASYTSRCAAPLPAQRNRPCMLRGCQGLVSSAACLIRAGSLEDTETWNKPSRRGEHRCHSLCTAMVQAGGTVPAPECSALQAAGGSPADAYTPARHAARPARCQHNPSASGVRSRTSTHAMSAPFCLAEKFYLAMPPLVWGP